jgi:hypothetical protein
MGRGIICTDIGVNIFRGIRFVPVSVTSFVQLYMSIRFVQS